MALSPRAARTLGLFAALFAAMSLGIVGVVAFLHVANSNVTLKLASLLTGRSSTFITEPAVVQQMQRLNRLETVAYSLDTVIEGRETTPLIPDVLAGDRLLMIVHGKTVAGIDLSKLQPKDVHIEESNGTRSIRIKLPPAEIFQTSIDDAHSRIYERSTGLFVRADPNLETQTRLKAQQQLQQAALSDGIQDAANKNATATITSLLQGLGFYKVAVD